MFDPLDGESNIRLGQWLILVGTISKVIISQCFASIIFEINQIPQVFEEIREYKQNYNQWFRG
jgi:hypothetical protein